MIGAGVFKKLVGGSVGVLGVAAAAARHAAWYVRYQTAGTARDEQPPPAGDRDEPGRDGSSRGRAPRPRGR